MNITFYVAPNVCGLKFQSTTDRDQFWSALSEPVRSATERIASRTLRFYPDKMVNPGFQWPLMSNGAKEAPAPIPPAPAASAPKTDQVTTQPFANIATNPTRALPGLVPAPPPEMLAVNQPPLPVEAVVAPFLTETKPDDPEPLDRRTKAWKNWNARRAVT